MEEDSEVKRGEKRGSLSNQDEMLNDARDFFEVNRVEIGKKVKAGEKVVEIDFEDFSAHSPELAGALVDRPEETIQLLEIALEELEWAPNDARARFTSISKGQILYIRNIRSKHLGKMIGIEGIVRQASEVRPLVTNAKFECPSCGTIISVLQIDKKFKEPSRCSCGRRGGFKEISKDMVDAQVLTIEEASDNLQGGEQPKRMVIFLKEDLVDPNMEMRTTPGSRVNIIGILKEIAITASSGAMLTRFDLAIEANNIIPLDESFEDIDINEEDERAIKELASSPDFMKKMTGSIAPSIWGHENVKTALAFQLFGGVRKTRSDGTKMRGDIHVLLVGDPGVAKSVMLSFIAGVAPKARYVSGKSSTGAGLCVSPKSKLMIGNGHIVEIGKKLEGCSDFLKKHNDWVWFDDEGIDFDVHSMSKDMKMQCKKPSKIWKLEAPLEVYEVCTNFGKKVELTGNTQLFVKGEDGMIWKKSMDLEVGDLIASPARIEEFKGEDIFMVDLIGLNPKLLGVEEVVGEVVDSLKEKYGTIREVAKKFGVNENNLYHNWVNDTSRGCISLDKLREICDDVGFDYRDRLEYFSLYNGKKHKIPVKVSEDVLYFAGLVAGDGDLRFAGNDTISIRFSNSCDELQNEFRKILKNEFGLSYDVSLGNEVRPEATRTHSKILGKILNVLGIPLSPKSDKIFVSDKILSMDNSLVSEFVSGLYDSDGSIYIRGEGEKGSSCIELTSCSENLIRSLQLVMLRYGIHASVRMRTPSMGGEIVGKLNRFVLEIRKNSDILKFIDNFKLRHPWKIEKLEILKEKLGDVIEDGDIVWERVVKIDKKVPDYEFVYDLTLDDTHNFVVDGLMVHNTATVVKDELLKGWGLEAGAMVLANKGLVCIDEFDKMDEEDRSTMHEAMEQQCMMPDFKLMLSNGQSVEIGKFVDELMEKNSKKVLEGKDCDILDTEDVELMSTDFVNHFPMKAARVSRHLA
ncbi:MAG: hypothetical protein KJ592_05100, partial [Nanoarchaeota archaeon]|nr:hypothetical protein [Nanoarchaeota archaeon]